MKINNYSNKIEIISDKYINNLDCLNIFYKPIIGSESFSIYLSFFEMNTNFLFEILEMNQISKENFIINLNKLEKIGLIFYNNKSKKILVKQPLSKKDFIKNKNLFEILTKIVDKKYLQIQNKFIISDQEFNKDEIACNFDLNKLKDSLDIYNIKIDEIALQEIASLSLIYNWTLDDAKKIVINSIDPATHKVSIKLLQKYKDIKMPSKLKKVFEKENSTFYGKSIDEFIYKLTGRNASSYELKKIESIVKNYNNIPISLMNFAIETTFKETENFNLKYLDKIISDWNQNKITDIESARSRINQFKKNTKKKKIIIDRKKDVFTSKETLKKMGFEVEED